MQATDPLAVWIPDPLSLGGGKYLFSDVDSTRVTFHPVLTVSPFLALQHVTDFENYGASVRDVVMKLGHNGVCIFHRDERRI